MFCVTRSLENKMKKLVNYVQFSFHLCRNIIFFKTLQHIYILKRFKTF